MAESRLRIVLTLKDQASQNIKSFNSGLSNIGKNAVKAFTGFATGVAAGTAAVAALGIAARKALKFAEAGAELERTQEKFERLADNIDASEHLMSILRMATRGLASDFELMASATDILSLGLVDNQDQLVRLMKVSGELGFDMNQLVLTLTNMTTMRFDALGVSVDGFKEKVKSLEDAGLSASDAFREAFLQQAEAQLEKVGSVADSTAGDFQKLAVQLKNVADAVKLSAAQFIGPYIGALAESFEATNTLREAVETHIITEEQFDALQDQRARGLLDNTRIMELYGEAIRAVARRESASASATAEFNQRLAEQAERLSEIQQYPPTFSFKLDLKTEDAFAQIREKLGLLERGAGELAIVADVLTEVDWSQVDPELRDAILIQGQALSMIIQANIEEMDPTQIEELKAEIMKATDIDPQHFNALWTNFEQFGSGAVTRWATDTLGVLQGTVSPAMQKAIQPLLTGVGRFTRSLDELDGRRIKIYVDFKASGDVPPGGYQHGGSFIVRGPSGPDRAIMPPVPVTSGERVTITPAGMQGNQQRGPMIGSVNISTELEGQAFLEQMKTVLRQA